MNCFESVVVLCDATPKTGLGHFMRCANLARTLVDQGVPTALVGNFAPLALELAAQLDLEVRPDNASIEQRARELPPGSRVIIDSYHFDPQALPGEHRYVLIDDFCRFDHFPVAGIVNFTINAEQHDYRSRGAGDVALGTAYFLPNPLLKHSVSPPPENTSNILISIGSSDQHGITSRILEALTATTTFNLRVIGSSPERLRDDFQQVEFVPPTPDIGAHYTWADLCITGGGLAKYECAWMGKPAAVISQTEAEHEETRDFASRRLCFDLGFAVELTTNQIADGLYAVLENPEARRVANTACLLHFTQDSAAKAAQFTRDCLQV